MIYSYIISGYGTTPKFGYPDAEHREILLIKEKNLDRHILIKE